MWSKRNDEQELIDLGYPHYTKEEYEECLGQLGKIGHFLGMHKMVLESLKKNPSKLNILEVGCGGGDLAKLIALKNPEYHVKAIDLNGEAIEYARNQLTSNLHNLSYLHVTEKQLSSLGITCDILICTLVCHHMGDEELIDFLIQARASTTKKIIIHDLHRHFLPYLFFKTFSPLLFPNRLIVNDGALSIKRAFRKNEWMLYLKKAGISPSEYKISWKWPFQWLVEIVCKNG